MKKVPLKLPSKTFSYFPVQEIAKSLWKGVRGKPFLPIVFPPVLKMRALVFDGKLAYRDDWPEPAVSSGEALVRVGFAGVCATDLEIARGYMGFKGVMGHEFVGVVEECADKPLVGRRVVGEINIGCGECGWCSEGLKNHCPRRTVLGILNKDGAFADYLTLPVKNLHVVPDSLSDEEALFAEPVAAAFEVLEQVEAGPGARVCVLGDGRLGLIVAQVLSSTGCDLTVCGRHGEKLSILSEKGIRTAIGVKGLDKDFDIIVDCTGSPSGLSDALALVRPRGTVVMKTTVAERGPVDLNCVVIDELTVLGSRCGPFDPAIESLVEGTVDVRPLITKKFRLEEGASALDYASKKGVLKVIIDVGAKKGVKAW